MEKIKIADLFCGIGGFRLGCEQACEELSIDCEAVFKSEIDKFAIQTYKENFGGLDADFKDIEKVDYDKIPMHNILFAGFPCQPFSSAGLRRGLDDDRGNFFINIYKVVKAKQPDAFILENVKNLLGHDGGRTFKIIMEKLESLDYRVHYKVFCATEYNLPQRRKRIFIVGFKNRDLKFYWPTPLFNKVCVGDVLDKNVSDDYTLSDHAWDYYKNRKEKNQAGSVIVTCQ